MISSTKISLGRVLSLGAVVAALATAGGFTALHGDDGSATTPPAISQVMDYPYVQGQAQRGKVVLYVVENDAQAAMIKSAENELELEADLSSENVPPRSYSIFKVTNPAEATRAELSIATSAQELGETNTTDVEVIDLRSR